MSFISGQYTATYDAATVGQIATGITLDHNFFKQIITGDNFAETPQDAVFRGSAVFGQYTLMEYDATSARKVFWPYGSSYLTMDTVIGTLDVDLANGNGNAAQLIMTVKTNTPADVANAPNTVTVPYSILAEGFNVSILFAPELRTMTCRQRFYPNASGVYGTLA